MPASSLLPHEPPCTGTENTPETPPGLWLPQSYEDLRAFVSHNLIYRDQSGARSVIRTAPGVVIKYGGTRIGFLEEVRAMEFVRRKTSIPIPRVLHAPDWYICMEEARGTSLDKTIESMTTLELDHIALQLKEYLKQLRSVTPKAGTLGSVTGGSYRNQYFPKQVAPDRPLDNTSQFIDEYRRILMLFCTQKFTDELLSPFPRDVGIVLSHGDLLPKNIMVDGSTITAIIDWELAGFYPEYLEYCRMNSDNFMTPKWHYIVQSVFPEDPRQPAILLPAQLDKRATMWKAWMCF